MKTGGRHRACAAIALLAVGLTPVAAGCGGSDDGPGDPAAAVRELQVAFAKRNLAAICARMTKPARDQAGSVAHGAPTTCRPDLRRAFGIVEEGGPWGQRPAIDRVRTSDDRATATLADGRWKADVPLTEEDGAWKLAGFFGAAPAEFDRYDRASPARPFPSPDGQAPQVAGADGAPCPALSDARYPEISGGCTFDVTSKSVPIRMLTPFGAFKFADCSVDYRLSVDARGRTWTQFLNVDGVSTTGCNDIEGCATTTQPPDLRPWKGRLASDGDGGFLHHVDMCVRTCIGLFAGDFVTRFVRDGKGWRIEPTDLGATGFRIDGALRVVGKRGIDIRAPDTGGGSTT